jgi:hypothetical protein
MWKKEISIQEQIKIAKEDNAKLNSLDILNNCIGLGEDQSDLQSIKHYILNDKCLPLNVVICLLDQFDTYNNNELHKEIFRELIKVKFQGIDRLLVIDYVFLHEKEYCHDIMQSTLDTGEQIYGILADQQLKTKNTHKFIAEILFKTAGNTLNQIYGLAKKNNVNSLAIQWLEILKLDIKIVIHKQVIAMVINDNDSTELKSGVFFDLEDKNILVERIYICDSKYLDMFYIDPKCLNKKNIFIDFKCLNYGDDDLFSKTIKTVRSLINYGHDVSISVDGDRYEKTYILSSIQSKISDKISLYNSTDINDFDLLINFKGLGIPLNSDNHIDWLAIETMLIKHGYLY